jgi:ParB family chromosome partitioning protein
MGKTAFDAKRGTTFLLDPEQLIIIDDEHHPRYDPRVKLEIDQDLVASINQLGVIQPVVICKDDQGRAVVVAGRRRVMAARAVNTTRNGVKVQVPCVLRAGEDADLIAASIAENELRRNDSPLEKARKAARLLNQGMAEEDVAVTFGVSLTAVKNWLTLLSAPAPVREAVDAGQISASAAKQVAALPAEKQEERLQELVGSSRRIMGKTRAKRGTVKAVKMRGRGEIEERMKTKNLHPYYRDALKWVLRQD